MAVRRKSTTLILVGVLVFLLGGVGVLIVLARGTHNTTQVATKPPAQTAPVASTGSAAVTVPIGAASLHIPAGMVALALQLGSTQAVGGYPVAGNELDIYGVFKSTQPANTSLRIPLAKLVLSNVKVLAIQEPPPSDSPGSTSVILAVTPAQAEGLIYLTTFESIYTTLVTPAYETPVSTPGRGPSNILAPAS